MAQVLFSGGKKQVFALNKQNDLVSVWIKIIFLTPLSDNFAFFKHQLI